MKYFCVVSGVLYTLTAWSSEPACGPQGAYRMSNGCMPVVFVIRHAEDTKSLPHKLTDLGNIHANLYPAMFDKYIWGGTHGVGVDKNQSCVCPIGKIISISDKGGDVSPKNPNYNPSSNPYKTVEKVSQHLRIDITTDNGETQYWSSFQWSANPKKQLFDYSGNSAQYSVLISWDKQGLNPTPAEYAELMKSLKEPASTVSFDNFTPLLKYFPAQVPNSNSIVMEPLKTNLWVFSDQDEKGKFKNLKFYQQIFYKKDCQTAATLTPTIDSACIVPVHRDY